MDTNLQFQQQLQDGFSWRTSCGGLASTSSIQLPAICRRSHAIMLSLRYEMGFRPSDRTYYMRAVQGHSRTDVFDEDLLERYTEESLPEVLLHGTKWHLYDAIRDQGIMPQALLAQEQGRSGKGRKGSEGRRHVHLISEEDRGQDVMSGFRENATMVIAVDARHAMRQGVQFYRSRNGVVLTSDRIPPASILHYESLRDHQKYDRRGNPM